MSSLEAKMAMELRVNATDPTIRPRVTARNRFGALQVIGS